MLVRKYMRAHDFWKEVKKYRKTKSNVSSCVDGAVGPHEICNIFVKKYQDLHNSVGFKKEDLEDINAEISEKIYSNCFKGMCSNSHTITVNIVCNAIKSLKQGKHDGNSYQMSDHFIHSSNKGKVFLSLLFQSILSHGTMPESLLLGTITPVPKNVRKSLNESINYRGITVSSVLGKILDIILLQTNSNALSSSPLQFGFKKDHSTSQCTFVTQEVINYYVNNKSSIYCVLLDASQAFDRVNFVRLFNLLLKRQLCPLVARLIAFMYTQQKLRVKYCNVVSHTFSVTNGVKQGGILSPVLFVVYINELFDRLHNYILGVILEIPL